MDERFENLLVEGIPASVPEKTAAVWRARLARVVEEFRSASGFQDVKLVIRSTPGTETAVEFAGDDIGVERRAEQFKAQEPLFDFDFLVVPDTVKEDLLSSVDLLRVERRVFQEWNLKKIEPFPRTALNFFGPPGTGKTLAAHALARRLGRKIMIASQAQIESKYHGEGPKNVESLFYAAERDGAVLFLDESDSLLSKRLLHVTQGSEQAINSMRSQLVICLEKFRGLVIFATNMVESYDKAFSSRVRHIYFPVPDEAARRAIWERHLPKELPRSPDVSPHELARLEGLSGRDIKTAVIDAAVRAASAGQQYVSQQGLSGAAERILAMRRQLEEESSNVESEVNSGGDTPLPQGKGVLRYLGIGDRRK